MSAIAIYIVCIVLSDTFAQLRYCFRRSVVGREINTLLSLLSMHPHAVGQCRSLCLSLCPIPPQAILRGLSETSGIAQLTAACNFTLTFVARNSDGNKYAIWAKQTAAIIEGCSGGGRCR
ncbi:hypothetical protein C8R46DRAFT_1112975 [Mycena filopes]|nr:hypothetical protein C8R46DRAFT_1112975 [Mycena filopes]